MAIVTTVPASALEFGNRIDAELYRPSLRRSFEKIFRTGLPVKHLRQVCMIRSGTTPPDRVDGLTAGPILFKTTDIRNGVIPPKSDYYRITDDVHRRMTKTKLEDRDVLLNIVGATLDVIGRSAFVSRLDDEANITQAMVFLRCQTPDVLPGFLFAYLNTKYGQDQIARYARPTGQYNLNLQEVGHLCIPLLPVREQQAIEQLVLSARDLQNISTATYAKAEQDLESALGLDNLTFQRRVGYIARFSDVGLLRRADAEFFNPELRYFQDELSKRLPLKLLPEVADVLKFSNPTYGTIGVPIITQKHLSNIAPSGYGDDLLALTSWTTKNPAAVLRKFDLLYYSVGAYLGKTNQWLANDEAVHASFITMLRCHTENYSGYLQVLLNSQYGVLQSKCFQSGTSQPYIYPKDIRRFLIPDASRSIRSMIHNLVIESYEKSRESKLLLEQAKARVEQIIEAAVQP
ncbi:MAG TPA: restriction endonuclease subunit S [Accumulibacter sp.]|uniref:restriction endonuclease subunit S n=1 Tax=Accumulibacter sp. TaxID=2053492 RepID=UPI002C3E1ED5|nr:restriction endonuclease subunit S [Accumulibacter sp.]HRF71459.1 restriction endonuclease subunit S [Accumulibacter sp.]